MSFILVCAVACLSFLFGLVFDAFDSCDCILFVVSFGLCVGLLLDIWIYVTVRFIVIVTF